MLVAAFSSYGYVQWRFGQVHRIRVAGLHPPVVVHGSPNPALTVLVVGSDTRDLGKGASSAFGDNQEVTGQRSDTIMLVHVVPATSSIALLSVPRDLLVNVAGYGTTRINAAFNGGPDLLVSTIQGDLGIEINHFVVVNFDTFTKIADAVGGVYQYFPGPARDLFSGLTVTHAGCVLLKGSQALGFVRSREYQYYLDGSWHYQMVPESDLARIQRQQAFVKLALKKAEQVGPTNPFALNDVLSGVTSSLTVDSGFSSSTLINLALDMRHSNVAGIPTWTYPTVNSTEIPGALDPVASEDQQVIQDFLSYGAPVTKTAAGATPGTPTIQRSSITVDVLNGSGAAGQAGQAAAALGAAGFKVGPTGDASAFDYTTTVVEYGPGGSGAARALQAQVEGGANLEEVTTLSTDHLVLITGQSYRGIQRSKTLAASAAIRATRTARSAAAIITTATTSTVDPSSSSFYHGRYIPPGLEPGQVPETCPS
jgi:LCP family protein required for cell wall assembly